MLSDRDYTRRLIQTVLTVAGVAILVAVMWAAREALMLIYVSALIAMGFSPLVRVIEQSPRAGGRPRLPRVLAILVIYLSIIAVFTLIGFLVLPPLIDQASSLWSNMPLYFQRFQTLLVNYKLLTHPITLQEAVQNAPAGSGGNAVGAVLVAVWGLVGGLFGVITVLILSFYLLIEAE